MTKNKPIRLIRIIPAAVILLLAACAPVGMDAQGAQNLSPTVVLVQYVTQVVATVTPAPPTLTPVPPTAQPVMRTGYDPYSVKVYYPLMGCGVASRLHVGERAFVANNRKGTLGLHMSGNIGDAPIFRKLNPGEILDLVEGPYCQTGSLVWGVIDAEDQKGFVAEGNGETYWLLPMGEKVDKETLKLAKSLKMRLGMPKYCPPR